MRQPSLFLEDNLRFKRIWILETAIAQEEDAIDQHEPGPGTPSFVHRIPGETRIHRLMRWKELLEKM